jgi:hypothetical protein
MNFTITKSVNFKMYWHMDDKLYKHVNDEQVWEQVCGQVYWLIHAKFNPHQYKIKQEINK